MCGRASIHFRKTGMLKRSWILGLIFVVVSTELTGDHVCQVEESYPVNVTEYLSKNTTVRNYKWCMGFPPRCSFYTFRTVNVPQLVERYETRKVNQCCPGYAKNKDSTGCVLCSKCFEGTCGNEGKCICNPGFQGDDCSNACQPMFWGIDCQVQCLCERGSCNPRTGNCNCPSGWFGPRCELNCLEGFYGKHCMNRCKCGERERCSPETGECFEKKTNQNYQDRQTTRSMHYTTNYSLNITNLMNNSQKSTPILNKYHTLESELNSLKTTTYVPRTIKWSTNEAKDSKFNKEKPVKTKIPYENIEFKISQTPKVKEKESSQESTTETSEEAPSRNLEDIPIINENGSFERNNSNRSLSDSINSILRANNVLKENRSEVGLDSNGSDSKKRSEYSPVINRTPFTNYKENRMTTTNEVFHTTKSLHLSSRDEVRSKTNEPTPPNTTPIVLKEFKTNENRRNFIEEETLQNLDSPHILTSKETTTLSATTIEVVGSNDGVLPYTEMSPTTKRLTDFNLDNDLPSIAQVEIHNSFRNTKENYIEKQEASSEFEYSSNSSEKSSLTAHMTLTALISFILIAVTALVVSANHYKRKKRKRDTKFKVENHQNYPGGPTVSVYAHSIFHTPLPDPPYFESPLFSSSGPERTHVLHISNLIDNSDEKEQGYTYDHPPSTGSYRAASIPEPPEINKETIHLEPLYDEIPSSDKKSNGSVSSFPSPCIYVNTCAKTKF